MVNVDDWFDSLLRYVIWPPHVTQMGQRMPVAFMGRRKPGHKVRYMTEEAYNFATTLEGVSIVRKIVENPFRLDYRRAEGNPVRQFVPDLLLILDDGRSIIVEVRTDKQMAMRANWQKWSALRAFCRQQGFGLLVTDGTRCIQDLSRVPVSAEVCDSLLTLLGKWPITLAKYTPWAEANRVSCDQLLAIIIKERLVYQPFPFMLARSEHVRPDWPECQTPKHLDYFVDHREESEDDELSEDYLDDWEDYLNEWEDALERLDFLADEGWYYPDLKPIHKLGEYASSPSRPVEDVAFKLLTLRRAKSK